LFLFAFKGPVEHRAAFSALLSRHAAWLGCETIEHGDFTWLGSRGAIQPSFQTNGSTTTAALFGPSDADPASPEGSSADTSVRFTVEDETVRIEVPLVTPEQAYYVEDSRGFVAANDLRPLLAWTGFEIDAVGAAALMQYGMVPAPHTVAQGVRRVPNGYGLTCRPGAGSTLRRGLPPLSAWTSKIAQPGPETARQLDITLAQTPPEAVVFFSGGTDSGLIAARLASAGRRNVQLVNYAFGEHDEESRNAQAIAAGMNLPFHRVLHDDSNLAALFDRIGADAIFPFNDLSVIPTHRMLHAAREFLPAGATALLGVGADDLYDGGLKIHSWARVQRLPRALRALMVGMLGTTRPWWRDDRSRRIWGILRRSLASDHSYGPPIMHNDLAEIGYPFEGVQATIEATWREIYDPFFAGSSIEDGMALVYLLNGGMGWEAPKFDLLRRFGVRSQYPFLDGPMLRHGFSLDWAQKCEGTKDKVLLKRLLRDSLPQSYPERPKVGFSPPYARLLTRPEIQSRMRAMLLEDGPVLGAFYDRAFVRQALDRGARGDVPNRGLMNLLWTAFYSASWVTQVRAALAP
jgi:asparagine synthase (glutamine-hydrolysing)